MNYEQLAIDKRRFINMTLEQEAEVQRLIKDIDVTGECKLNCVKLQ